MNNKIYSAIGLHPNADMGEKVLAMVELLLQNGAQFTLFHFSGRVGEDHDDVPFSMSRLRELYQANPSLDQLHIHNKITGEWFAYAMTPDDAGIISAVMQLSVTDVVLPLSTLQIKYAYACAYADWQLEGLPGRSQIMNWEYKDSVSFFSCAHMYFDPVYYKYVPKPLFDAYTQCEENVILANGVRKITLYKDIFAYEAPENRGRQWAFRRELGIDSIVHEFIAPGRRKQPDDLPVLITRKDVHKGSIRVIRFIDEDRNTMRPSIASGSEIREYDETGTSIVYEKINYTR